MAKIGANGSSRGGNAKKKKERKETRYCTVPIERRAADRRCNRETTHLATSVTVQCAYSVVCRQSIITALGDCVQPHESGSSRFCARWRVSLLSVLCARPAPPPAPSGVRLRLCDSGTLGRWVAGRLPRRQPPRASRDRRQLRVRV